MAADMNVLEMEFQQGQEEEEEVCWWDGDADDFEGLLPSLPLLTPSQERCKEEILEAIANPEIAVIRIAGRRQVGIRTIMQQVVNQVLRLCLFDVALIIYVRGSKVEELQEKIAKGLSLNVETEESVHSLAEKIRSLLERKKYLLFLNSMMTKQSADFSGYPSDECMEGFGIPEPNQQNGCKIVTTEHFAFGDMIIATQDEIIVVEDLSKEEAWELFHEKAGEVSDSPNIQPLARRAVEMIYYRQDQRDSTAISLAGAAMKDVKDESRWVLLSQSFRFNPFRFWYESIASDEEKLCCSYCCLFEAEYEFDINELIGYWIMNGLFDGFGEEGGNVYRKGLRVLKQLLDSCILQRSAHNSATMDRQTYMNLYNVDNRFTVSDSEYEVNWKLPESLSLHNITRMLDSSPNCPKLLTLLLQGASKSAIISPQFLNHMPNLRILHLHSIELLPWSISNLHDLRALVFRDCKILQLEQDFQIFKKLVVLDVSGTIIESLPESVSTLENLRKLLAKNCCFLKSLPDLAALQKLKVLDLSGTWIKEFPSWIFKLIHLRCLNWYQYGCDSSIGLFPIKFAATIHVSDANFFCTFPKQAQSLPQWLQQFYFSVSPCVDRVGYDENYFKRKQFVYNHIYLKAKYFPTYASRNRWFEINGSSSPWGSIKGALNHTDLLSLKDNMYLLGLSELGFKNMKELRECLIERCHRMEIIVSGEEVKDEMILGKLENLFISNLSNLTSVCLGTFLSGSFACLKHVYLDCCPKLENIFSSPLLVENLETLEIKFCDKLEMIFKEEVEVECVLPNLKSLLLWELVELKSICREDNFAPRLEKVIVKECPKLNMLPLDSYYARTQPAESIEEIMAEQSVVQRRRHRTIPQLLRSSYNYLKKIIFTSNIRTRGAKDVFL